MLVLDLTLPTIFENLALDEALLLEAERGAGHEVLRFWELPAYAVVLGSGCVLSEDVHRHACDADAVPIARRASGGGTVLLGAGSLCYTLVLSYDRAPELAGIRASYCYILGRIQTALADVLPDVTCAGTSDLAIAGHKFSGNSQQRKRTHLLHHGTLLYNFDLPRISRYLALPARQPDYRQQRAHEAFLRNFPLPLAALKARLANAWDAHEATQAWPKDVVARLSRDKYATPAWIERR